MTNKKTFENRNGLEKETLALAVAMSLYIAYDSLFERGFSTIGFIILVVHWLLFLLSRIGRKEKIEVYDEGIEHSYFKNQAGVTFVSWCDLDEPFIKRRMGSRRIELILPIKKESQKTISPCLAQRLCVGQRLSLFVHDMKDSPDTILDEILERYHGAQCGSNAHISAERSVNSVTN